MKHSVDSRREKERPNLLSSSNRNSIPTIDILSSLENRQNLKSNNAIGRKKIFGLTLIIVATIGVIGFLQFEKLQNLNPTIAGLFSSSNSTDQNIAPLASANRLPEVNKLSEPAAPSIIDDINTTLEPTAVLIDIPIDKEKAEVSSNVLSDLNIRASSAKDSKQENSLPSISTNSASANTTLKGKVSPQNMTTKKHGAEIKNDVEKTNKDPLKLHTNTEKNRPKTYDNDIALLSALVANSPKLRNELSSNVSNPTSTKKSVPPPINLDVVERNPGDNTRSLLSRCEKLGGAEAKLCHDRICSGSWQSESVCSPSKG